ncbi:hypothetical protein CK203_099384 [Vitis vinifera]|uniref:Uncharacterized protein n=1 Tax=Vitis vinifera TaxID=29760 RepID=A0A438CHR1_VITVI|nr:hypothetical protein CK203_099384 [Vitis vinifera]
MSTSSLEQAILKISKVMEDFVGEQQKINSHLNEKIDNMESSINVRMEGVYNDLSLRIEKVQDSIEKLTNLDIARGKRKLPPQPHHNLQGTNAKRSRKVLRSTLWWGIAMITLWTNLSLKIIRFKMIKGYLNPLKHPLLQGREEKRIPLDQMGRMPILFGIQGEFSMKWWYDACKNRSYGENKGKQGRKAKTEQFAPPHFGNFGHISITSEVHFMCTISVSKLGKSGSNASNGVQIGVETKKLWSLQENWTELSGNFAPQSRCEKFRTVRNTLLAHECHFAHLKPILHHAKQGAKISVQGASISHTTIQGAKFIPTCEFECENFATVGHNFEPQEHALEERTRAPFETLWKSEQPPLSIQSWPRLGRTPCTLGSQHQASHSISYLLKPSKPIAPTESSSRGDYATQGDYQSRGQCPDPTHSEGHHISTDPSIT